MEREHQQNDSLVNGYLRHAILTGATFNNADLSDANLDDATFSRFKLPPRKAPARRNAQLGKAVAKAVGKGLVAEVQGGSDDDDDHGTEDEDDADDDDSNELAEDEEDRLFSLQNVAHALDRMATAAADGLELLLRARTALCTEFEEIKQLAAEWSPPAVDDKAVRGEAQKLETAAAKMMHAKADELFETLEAVVIKALSDTSVGGLATAAPEGDEHSGGPVKELGKAVLWSLVGDARQLLAERATPLISEAAKGISFSVDRRQFETEATPLLSGASDSIQAAATDVAAGTDIEKGLQLLSPAAVVAKDMRDQLLKVLKKLGKILNASLDKQIQRKLKKFGSSLLDKTNSGVKQLGALKRKADELEKKLKEKLTGSAAAIDTLGLQLLFELVDTSKDGKIELAKFKDFAQNAKLEGADDKILEKWFAEMVAITKELANGTAEEQRDKAGERVDFAGLEAWLAKNHDGPIGKWVFDRGLAKFLPTGKLGERLCKDRIKRELSGQTAYSETGLCGTVSDQFLLPWNPSHSMDPCPPLTFLFS